MPSFAMVFPGQGSQRVGMLAEADSRFPQIREAFSEASDAIDFDLWKLISDGPGDTLNLTENTQPAILASSIALYRAWLAVGGEPPKVAAGHSLGEYSALVAAGALTLGDAVKLVKFRGQAMQDAVPLGEGAMAVVLGLNDSAIIETCHQIALSSGKFVGGVNFNAPGQVVIAGITEAVGEAIAALKKRGARRAMSLPVSAPFHTPLMAPAARRMKEVLTEVAWQKPAFSVVSNVDGRPKNAIPEIISLLVKQVESPVKWTDCMNQLVSSVEDCFIECGPGQVLSGLARRIKKGCSAVSIEQPQTLLQTVIQFRSG